ncbi:MAG: hypothetical protein IRY83_17055 [Chloroflexi bacterium]|nr:hypothetical protein [Chloroflexota bacterium]
MTVPVHLEANGWYHWVSVVYTLPKEASPLGREVHWKLPVDVEHAFFIDVDNGGHTNKFEVSGDAGGDAFKDAKLATEFGVKDG